MNIRYANMVSLSIGLLLFTVFGQGHAMLLEERYTRELSLLTGETDRATLISGMLSLYEIPFHDSELEFLLDSTHKTWERDVSTTATLLGCYTRVYAQIPEPERSDIAVIQQFIRRCSPTDSQISDEELLLFARIIYFIERELPNWAVESALVEAYGAGLTSPLHPDVIEGLEEEVIRAIGDRQQLYTPREVVFLSATYLNQQDDISILRQLIATERIPTVYSLDLLAASANLNGADWLAAELLRARLENGPGEDQGGLHITTWINKLEPFAERKLVREALYPVFSDGRIASDYFREIPAFLDFLMLGYPAMGVQERTRLKSLLRDIMAIGAAYDRAKAVIDEFQ